MINLCKEIQCKHWSDGRRDTGGSLGGYGCRRYSTASNCPAAFIQGVTSTEYELDRADGAAPMVTLCAIACLPLTDERAEISKIAPIPAFSDHPSLKGRFVELLYSMGNCFYLANQVELVRIFPQRLDYGNLGDPYRELARLAYSVYPDDQSLQILEIEIVDAVRLAQFIGTSVGFCVDPELIGHPDYQQAHSKLFGGQ
jgi:hypothetical protein